MPCKSIRRLLSAAAFGLFAVLGSAHADNIDFESLPPQSTFGSGDMFTASTNYRFTQLGNFGLVSTSAGFAFMPAPTGNDTQFYSVLNDSSLSFNRTDGAAFRLGSFDAAFLSPFPQDPGVVAGRIFIIGTDTFGNTLFNSWEFGASADDGTFGFQNFGTGSLRYTELLSATFIGCIYGDSNVCSNPFQNLAQFSLDNIVVSVPEPSSFALLALGLLIAVGCSRRVGR